MTILTQQKTSATLRRTQPLLPVGTALAVLVLAVLAVAVIAPQLLTAKDPFAQDLAQALLPPSAEAWFGTDQLGRDVYTRVVYGARESLAMGLGATLIALILGAVIGVISAASPRFVDTVITRVIDIVLAFPNLLLALLVITIVGPFVGRGTVSVIISLGIGMFAGYARVVRSQALVVRRSGYVEAAVAMGASRSRILWAHITPAAIPPLLVLATISVGVAIIGGSGLSFLGLGPEAPTPEWGLMVAEGRNLLAVAWWTSAFPGLAITITVIAITTFGRHLQRRARTETA